MISIDARKGIWVSVIFSDRNSIKTLLDYVMGFCQKMYYEIQTDLLGYKETDDQLIYGMERLFATCSKDLHNGTHDGTSRINCGKAN